MFSCSCSQWWWVSSSTFLNSSRDFLVLPARTGKNGLHGLHVAVINLRVHPVFEQMKLINVPFFLLFFSLPNIYRPWIVFINKLLRKYGTNCLGSFILSGELNGDVKGAACNNKSVLQMACQEKDTESLKSLQTELWWASRGIHVNDIAPPHFSLLAYLKCLYWLCICPPSRPFLTAEQNHLLHLVVQERITPSGQGI